MFLLIVGLVLLVVAQEAFQGMNEGVRILDASGFFIAMGFFGTFSGITNLVANVFLFYGIPYLPGTGLVVQSMCQSIDTMCCCSGPWLCAVTNVVCVICAVYM